MRDEVIQIVSAVLPFIGALLAVQFVVRSECVAGQLDHLEEGHELPPGEHDLPPGEDVSFP